MAKPLILYENMLRQSGATLSIQGSGSPTTDPAFPLENLKDYRSYSLWKPTSVTASLNVIVDLGASGARGADYFMLVNHNYGQLGSSDIEIRRDTVTPPTAGIPTSATSSAVIGNQSVYYKTFTDPGSFRYWALHISGHTDIPYIGELFIGLKTELPHYLTPTFDPFFKQVEVHGSRSRGGHYLGASLLGQQHRGIISFGDAGAARADYTATINAFLDDHAFKRFPFGFVVDSADTDFDRARYVKVPDDDRIERFAVGGTWQNLALQLPVEEAFSETP